MIVNDIWGQIRVEPQYEKIINTKEFNDLKNKNQLGLNTNSNAIHTRYQHSIGTYFLAIKLIEICKNKFNNILNITKDDEEVIKLTALIHDIGHGPFSHVSESYLKGSHEEKTMELLLDENTEIHKVIVNELGENILLKTIDLIKNKEMIKNNKKVNTPLSLIFIIEKLLCGGIDIDRIDYIFRDSKFVYGEETDFFSILESINLEYIDDSLEIVFDDVAEYNIANFFNKRFEMYDNLYLDNKTRMLESIFNKFLSITNKELAWDTSEIELNNYFRENTMNKDEVTKRYAELLSSRKLDDNFLIKEINEKNVYENYKSRIFSNIPELNNYKAALFESFCKVKIYNQDNKIFINKGGIIQDISQCSKILNSNLYKEKYIIGVDITLLKKLLLNDGKSKEEIDIIIKKIRKLISPEIEQEKKYTFKKDSISPKEGFKLIKEKLGLDNPEYIKNLDTYYDDIGENLSKERIAIRKRISGNEEEWNVKKPIKDKTSISKRDEKTFKTMEEVLYFLQNEWNLDIRDLKEIITLETLRAKYDLKYGNGSFEFVFDKTTPIKDKIEYQPNYMIECELKKGNSSGLYFINEILKAFDFIEECKQSKKEFTLNKIKNHNNELNYVLIKERR